MPRNILKLFHFCSVFCKHALYLVIANKFHLKLAPFTHGPNWFNLSATTGSYTIIVSLHFVISNKFHQKMASITHGQNWFQNNRFLHTYYKLCYFYSFGFSTVQMKSTRIKGATCPFLIRALHRLGPLGSSICLFRTLNPSAWCFIFQNILFGILDQR